MTDWTAGYVADIGYTYGCYPELNPLRVDLAFLNAGLVPPKTATACELGFGQGVSVNFNAAATDTEWHGTDFNPAQAGFAQELAQASGGKAHLHDDAFAEFASRPELPDFDYIGLHGIWSWISDENRAVIVDFVRRKLKVGGVLYISYNTLPGWASFAPMRHLMTQHAETMGSEGQGILSRIGASLDFSQKLLATKPGYAKANPQVDERLKKIVGQNQNYLAHEYFNKDWEPMHFATMAQWLEPAKLQFACSAHYHDHVDAFNLTPEQREFLNAIPDAMFRQTVRDYMVNQQFRRDYWVKGARKLNPLEQAEGMRAQRIMLTVPRADISFKVNSTLGEVSLNEPVYTPILDVLADHKPRTIAQLEQAVKDNGISYGQVVAAMVILGGAGHVAIVQDDAKASKRKPYTDKLNAHLMRKARSGGDISYLASPLTGGAIPVGRFGQLFLLALQQGKKQPAEWAQFAWSIVAAQSQRIVKEGKTLETPEENLAELTRQAEEFAGKTLGVLRALQVA